MSLNISIDKTEAWEAFSLKKLMPIPVEDAGRVSDELKRAVADANVSVFPAAAVSDFRILTWKFDHVVVANDESSTDALLEALAAGVAAIPAGARATAGDPAAAFQTGMEIFKVLTSLYTAVTEFLDHEEQDDLVAVTPFSISFDRPDPTKSLFVGYRVRFTSRHVSTDKDDTDESGFNQCQRLAINSRPFRGPRRNNRAGTSTNTYQSDLAETIFELRPGQTQHLVSMEVLSHAECGWDLFMNLNTELQLVIYVGNTRDEVTALMEAPRTAMAPESGERRELEAGGNMLASTVRAEEALEEPPELPPALGEPFPIPGGPMIPMPGNFGALAMNLRPEVLPRNTAARRLISDLSRGRTPHLGLHLSRLPLRDLRNLGEGLGLERSFVETADETELGEEIGRFLIAR